VEGERVGPVASAKLDIDDKTAPTVTRVQGVYKSPSVRVEFSEPVDPSAADASHFSFEPKLEVKSVTLGPSKREAVVTLAQAPETDRRYALKISGIKDGSARANTMEPVTMPFAVRGPAFSVATVSQDQMGKAMTGVKGLPVHAADQWTLNMFVKTGQQPANRTLIAGFGRCADDADGQGRYLGKFAGGAHFWSRNRDVPTRTQLELNRWQMLTATYDGKVLRVYKDGQKIGEREVALMDDEPVVTIAPKDPWEQKRTFDGEIRELTIWNTALPEEALGALKASVSLP
jgi:alpha-mannosidase